jgi:hypothetical protein
VLTSIFHCRSRHSLEAYMSSTCASDNKERSVAFSG